MKLATAFCQVGDDDYTADGFGSDTAKAQASSSPRFSVVDGVSNAGIERMGEASVVRGGGESLADEIDDEIPESPAAGSLGSSTTASVPIQHSGMRSKEQRVLTAAGQASTELTASNVDDDVQDEDDGYGEDSFASGSASSSVASAIESVASASGGVAPVSGGGSRQHSRTRPRTTAGAATIDNDSSVAEESVMEEEQVQDVSVAEDSTSYNSIDPGGAQSGGSSVPGPLTMTYNIRGSSDADQSVSAAYSQDGFEESGAISEINSDINSEIDESIDERFRD